MQLTIKLYGALRKYRPATAAGAPHQPFPFSISDKSTIHDLMHALEIADGAVNAAAVNGDSVPNDTILHDGDSVGLFPPAAGGKD